MTKEGKIFILFTIIYSLANFTAFQLEVLIFNYDKIFATNYHEEGIDNLLGWAFLHFSSLLIWGSILVLIFFKKQLMKYGISIREIIFWKIILFFTFLSLLYEGSIKFLLPKIFFNFILFSVYIHPQKGLIYRPNMSSFFLFIVSTFYIYKYSVRQKANGC